MTLGFWYLFQEALWCTNYYFEDGDQERSPVPPDTGGGGEAQEVLMAKAVYSELVKVLRRKVVFPPTGSGWLRGRTACVCFYELSHSSLFPQIRLINFKCLCSALFLALKFLICAYI